MAAYHTDDECIFCKIVKGDIPSFKLVETDKTLAFLDIGATAKGHALVIPKYHGNKLHDVPDEYLSELLPIAKKLAVAVGAEDYNILQNNGKIAHQEVGHVHVHMIPKPTAEEGLVFGGWPATKPDFPKLTEYHEELKKGGKL
ncbi:hit family protein 1 [Pseudohyphozyma bogoriensis]|nr:hit family protein 1 [Pseudohyphozyma bogoriensis]